VIGNGGLVTTMQNLLPARAAAALAVVAAMSAACSREANAYAPGLGEIMTFTQLRHQKLWLAGDAGNWPLAAYEIDELEEGFQDAIAFHPTDKSTPVPIAQAIPAQTGQPIAALRAAIGQQDRAAFARAFDGLTTACNTCHALTNHAFNVVVRPAGSSFPNQRFEPAAK
jgi:hypothetical protein